ncbi:universal stress protein [Winogradskyella sp. DF17]|jgi:nucleotide-binding universal stress UspA family protein|uniref:Universal stress protein n=1 Tax=Winogradskyella pelagia TaxID=2819984 RepID=A0ABS3T0J9_9FLAO|nr:universal stress protein [Winogradskyella sp. DF17]MBO3115969.1 universal stress protein [Winogradskyella sp. DF17]
MKRKILLPTDFSDNAWSAVDYAIKLFKDETCSFYLLNSIALKVSTMSNFSNSLLKVMKEKAIEELKELKSEIEAATNNPNHEFKTILSTLDLYDAITYEVKTNNIEFVVMGTKGATGAKELFFGSNTVRVIKKLKGCPLLIVPNEYHYVEPRQLAFPTDFKIKLGEGELQILKTILSLYNSQIRILHINEEEELSEAQEANYENLKTQLEGYNYSFHWMPEYSTKANEIKEFIEDLKIDMLAMVNHKKSWIERIATKPVIKKIGFHPFVPFLVIPA